MDKESREKALADLGALERRMRQRFAQNGSHNDDVEIAADRISLTEAIQQARGGYTHLTEELPIEEVRRRYPRPRADGLRPGHLFCDCICNCGSIVCVAFKPEKGTEGVLCMTCLELSRRKDPHHMPWPASGVVVLPPEK